MELTSADTSTQGCLVHRTAEPPQTCVGGRDLRGRITWTFCTEENVGMNVAQESIQPGETREMRSEGHGEPG